MFYIYNTNSIRISLNWKREHVAYDFWRRVSPTENVQIARLTDKSYGHPAHCESVGNVVEIVQGAK